MGGKHKYVRLILTIYRWSISGELKESAMILGLGVCAAVRSTGYQRQMLLSRWPTKRGSLEYWL